MNSQLTRREMIKGSIGFAGLALTQSPLSSLGFAEPESGAVQIPFLDVQPPGKMVRWEQLKTWITPNEQVFSVSHYGTPDVKLGDWHLEISGLIRRPRTLSLAEIKARKQKSVIATLECSGNSSNPAFMGAIGNVKWTGTALAPLLKECELLDRGIEVVFFGADEKVEKIRDNEYLQNFARSLSRSDALKDDLILAYEMNGEPLETAHGAPLRLIVPGWFGIAWVKWLSRIEVLDRRYMSKYMAREYVTLRGEDTASRTIWRETSVGPIDLKSMVARAVRQKNGSVRLSGAAWTDGTPLKRVEVRIDEGPWMLAEVDKKQQARYAWSFWNYEWKNPSPGDHSLVSRAMDAEGRAQPPADDSTIKLKRTYWEANQQYVRKIRI